MQIPVTKIVNEYVNAEVGICVAVVYTDSGYGVQITDMDSNLVLPAVRIYETQAQAQAYALRCAFA